jgi:endoglycosylceramidase
MRRRRKRTVQAGLLLGLAALASVGATAGAGASQAAVPKYSSVTPVPPVVGHIGRWLVDSSGRVILLHGLNMVAKGHESPAQEGFSEADAQWLRDNGFDLVRLGLTAAALMKAPGVINKAYLASFETTVKQLTSAGLLVLIDLHQDGWGPTLGSDGFPKWMTLTHGAKNTHTPFPLYYVTNPAIQAAFQSLWDDDEGPGNVRLQTRVAQIFSALARANASNPAVLGYDLLNEPWPGTTWKPCLDDANGCPSLEQAGLDPYYARMDAAIRLAGDKHIVFGEPYVLFNFGKSATHIALPGKDPKSGLSFHMYTLSASLEPKVIANAISWSKTTGGALLETEFGATTSAAVIDRMVGEDDSALLPWIFWSFDGIIKNLADPPTAGNFYQGAVGALVRPHPIAVAGTPSSLSYDTTSRAMTFTWSTTGPNGRHYAAATATLFDVPFRSYPSGYHVTVVGGRVTSQAEQSLSVVATAGAARVTVRITPAP